MTNNKAQLLRHVFGIKIQLSRCNRQAAGEDTCLITLKKKFSTKVH